MVRQGCRTFRAKARRSHWQRFIGQECLQRLPEGSRISASCILADLPFSGVASMSMFMGSSASRREFLRDAALLSAAVAGGSALTDPAEAAVPAGMGKAK